MRNEKRYLTAGLVVFLVLAMGLTTSASPLGANELDENTGDFQMGLAIPEYVKEYWRTHRKSLKYNTKTFKSSIDWSFNDSPVKSQGHCGSCWAFAGVALIENLGDKNDLAEQVIVSCAPGNCGGGWYGDVLRYTHYYGIPPEDCYPYLASNGNCNNKCTNPAYLEKVEHYDYYGQWGYPTSSTVNDLKTLLQEGPACVAMLVSTDGSFYNYSGGIYNYDGGPIPETRGHAVLVVGYNDDQQYFRAKNSWGAGWGENGYFRIAYDDVTDDVCFGMFACTASGVYTEEGTTQCGISGYVRDSNNNGVAGVTMVLSGHQSKVTSTYSSGYYVFNNLECNYDYTVIPSKVGCSFNPTSRSYSPLSANQSNQNYTAYCGTELVITTDWLPDGYVDVIYGITLEATGGVKSYFWSLESGDLPPGLDLNSVTGAISGSPIVEGTYDFTVKVTDSDDVPNIATKDLRIVITKLELDITTSSLPDGAVGFFYRELITAVGGEKPYAWSKESGTLPPGLVLSSTTGSISGTPITKGIYNFTAKVTDSETPAGEAIKDLSIRIKPPPPLTITTTALPNGLRGTFYSYALAATGGVLPYDWQVTMGSLPLGLALDSSGVLSGVPTSLGNCSFGVKVTDSDSTPNTDSKFLSIAIRIGVPELIAPEDSAMINHDIPTFIWNSAASGGGRYTLEYALDSTFVFEKVTLSNIFDTTYSVPDTSSLLDTVYYWHVKAVKGPYDGDYQDHPYTFTIDTKAPEIPTLISPPDSLVTRCDTINFAWSVPKGAVRYILQCATDVGYSHLVIDTLLMDTTFNASFSDATYYWHVKAIDEANNESGYQEHSFTFTVDTEKPEVPALMSPANGSYINDPMPTFAWTTTGTGKFHGISTMPSHDTFSIASFVTYCLQIATDQHFIDLVADTCYLVDTTYTTISPLFDTRYYWRVKASDYAGNKSSYSPAFYFTVDVCPPESFSLILPVDSSWVNATRPTFQWQASSDVGSRIDGYCIYIDDTLRNCTNCVSWTSGNDLHEGDHVWHVTVYDSAGNHFDSEKLTFGVDTTPPDSPTLISPENGFAVNESAVTFLWHPAQENMSGIDYYVLFIAQDSLFTTPVITVDSLLDTSYMCVLSNDSYYWCVIATDVASNTSTWSEIRGLTVNVGVQEEADEIPTISTLSQNVPNPFSLKTSVKYAVNKPAHVTLSIYDVTGNLVNVITNETRVPGYYSVHWDGRDDNGEKVTSGIYFYKIQVNGFTYTRKMILMK